MALTSCIPAGYGWSTWSSANRPTYVTGASASGAANGYLPADMLVYVNSSCRVASYVAGPLVNMLEAAANAGIQLWTVSCYRSYAQQVAVRQRWCALGRCNMAALPGTSNHGWGKAVDLGEPGGMTFTSPGHRWLSANAYKYGFVGLSFEAWHWSYEG